MQAIAPVTTNQLLAAGQVPLLKVEIYVSAAWVNLCNLDSKNYVEDVSISLGGAGMTPNPIGGTLSVTLSNEGSIFHPLHPTSGYEDYIKAGRKVKISVGANYGGTPYYWQRMVGYIDEPNFETPSFKVNISGADYMKFLEDLELRSPDTLWRGSETFDSIADDGRGATEYYNEADAMDIDGEADNVTNWIASICTFNSILGATDNTGDTTLDSPIITGMTDTSDFYVGQYVRVSAGFPAGTYKILEKTADSLTLDADATSTVANVTVSYYVGKVLLGAGANGDPAVVRLENVFVPVVGVKYNFRFQYKAGPGAGKMRVVIYHHNGDYVEIARKEGLERTEWTQEDLIFTATSVDPIEIWIYFYDGAEGEEWYLDLFTIRKYTPPEERYYEIAGACKGIYRVLLDKGEGAGFEDVWQGEEDEGWYYTAEEEFGPDPPAHPAKIVWFDKNKTVPNGTNNLKIQYFITVSLENMVADILVTAGLYANRAAAIDAIDDHPDYLDPNIDIDQCWFKVGEPALSAIRMICQRADYRFHFTWEGKPAFIPAPSYSDALTDGGLNVWASATDLTNWTEYKEGTSTINREATEKIEGDYSCRLDVDASNSQVQFYQMNIPLTPLKRQKVIIWYKNSVAGKNSQFYIRDLGNNVYLKEDGTWNVGAYWIVLPNSLIWTPYEVEFYAHPDYSSYLMLLREKLAASSSIYFDKVSIWREEFTFTNQKHIESFSNYQDRNEIWNRVIIEGRKRAEPVNLEGSLSSEFSGEASDATSITAYGERTLTIKNHLFDNQADLDAMCATLLAEYKDPKWYADIEVPFNPVPLELGDKITWKERLSPTVEITQTGIIRDIKINLFSTTYKCVIV